MRGSKASAGHTGDAMTWAQSPRLPRLGVMILVLGLCTVTCRPLLLLILPGMLVMYLPWWRHRHLLVPPLRQDPLELLGLWGTRGGGSVDGTGVMDTA